MTPHAARLEFGRMSPTALSARIARAIEMRGGAWTIGYWRKG